MTTKIPFSKSYTEESSLPSNSPGNDMLSKMQSLFAEYPEVDLRALGFPSGDWQDEPLWSTQI